MLKNLFLFISTLHILAIFGNHNNCFSQNFSSKYRIFLKKQDSEIIHKAKSNTHDSCFVEKVEIIEIQAKIPFSDLVVKNFKQSQQNSGHIISEGFEENFPDGKWKLRGNPSWGKTTYKSYEGSYSAWCARSGSMGTEPRYSNYPSNCNAYMVYGPFSLKDVDAAELNFRYWLSCEKDYDYFSYLTSQDGSNFKGYKISGDYSKWSFIHLNLDTTRGLYKENTWIAFSFTSDATREYKGVFLDNINIIKSNWRRISISEQNRLSSVYFVNKKIGWIVGSDGIILKTIDGGNNWASQMSGTSEWLLSVYFFDADTGWTVGTGGTILKTTNGGNEWEKKQSGTSVNLKSMFFTYANTGWVVGSEGTILKTINGGNDWKKQQSGVSKRLNSIYFIDDNIGWIVGNSGTILKTTNKGKNWIPQFISGSLLAYFHSIFFHDAYTGWLVGDLNGTILKTTDGGVSWFRQESGFPYLYKSIYFANVNTGWLLGTGDTILKTIDGGTTWKRQASGTTLKSLESINFTDVYNGWIVGEDGTILKTSMGGGEPHSSNYPPQLVSPSATVAYEDSFFEYTARAFDPEGSVISFTFLKYPSWLTPADSTISGIPQKGTKDTSFVVVASDGELSDTLLVHVTVISATFESFIYNFPQQGWYLISLPVVPSDNKLSTLFPTALNAFGYEPNTGSYYSVTELNSQKGYWLLIPSATSVTISGTPLANYTEHYPAGWHLIGTVNKTINFTDPDDNPNGSVICAYGWDVKTSQYFQVYPVGTGVLEAKQGYWLAALQDCDLTIGAGTSASAKASAKSDMEIFRKQFGSQPPSPPFVAEQNVAQLPQLTELTALNYPNPFNPETVIEYALPKSGLTRVSIYNSLGQRIRILHEKEQVSGIYKAVWDSRDDKGNLAPSGIYFYRITNSGSVKTGKMLLLK